MIQKNQNRQNSEKRLIILKFLLIYSKSIQNAKEAEKSFSELEIFYGS